MNDWFILLTWFKWRLGSKSHLLKCLWLVSSSAYVRRSIRIKSRSNLTMIRNQSHLDWIAIKFRTWGSQRTQGFPQKLLNFFAIQSRLKIQRGRTPFYRRNRRENRGPSDSVKIDRQPQSRYDRGPRSHDLLIFLPSNEATCRDELSQWCDWIATIGFHLFRDLRRCPDDDRVDRNPPD